MQTSINPNVYPATTGVSPFAPNAKTPHPLRRPYFGDAFSPVVTPPASFASEGASYYSTGTSLPGIDPNRPHYSDLKPLLAARQVREVKILVDPNSLSHLPTANVTLKNGNQCTLLLPHDMKAFTKELEQAQVPYTYQSAAPKGAAKVADWAGGIASDLVGPFILLFSTGAISMLLYQRYNSYLETRQLQEGIRNAHKKDVSGSQYEELKTYHEPFVQARLDEFLHGQTPVLVAKGYPGLGKTHILSALAGATTEHTPDSMLLDVGTDVSQNVRQLLKNIYCGDKEQTAKAMRVLEQEKGGPVKTLLLYADELEHISPQDEIRDLIIKGIGNPSNNPDLPKLRVLATCNTYPDYLHHEAVESRITRFLIPPPTPESNARILAGSLQKKLQGQVLPEQSELLPALTRVLTEYAGYSPRTLMNKVTPTLVRALSGNRSPQTVDEIVKKLENTLDNHRLNPTELAGLMGQMIIDNIMHSRDALHPQKGPISLWETILHDSAKNATQEVGDKVSADGKIARQEIARALETLHINIADPGSLDSACNDIVKLMKSRRLSALRQPLTPLQQTEADFIQKFVKLIQKIIQTEEKAPKTEKSLSKAESEQMGDFLRRLQAALRNLNPQSPAGRDLTQAALLYQVMKANPESHQPDKTAFLTKEKIDAVFRRVLDFNPEKHPVEADFVLTPDANYVELFQRLHRMMNTLGKGILRNTHLPR